MRYIEKEEEADNQIHIPVTLWINCQVALFKLEYGQICASLLSKSVQKKEENIAIIGNFDFDVKQCLRVYE